MPKAADAPTVSVRPGARKRNPLDAHLAKYKSVPFLLVGSGLSRRYLGLDDWEGLLRRLAGLTSKSFEEFRSLADNDFPTIATLISDELVKAWWSDPAFSDSRARYEEKITRRHGPLKAEVSRIIALAAPTFDGRSVKARELKLLRAATIDGVITTNYDRLMEDTFPTFHVFVGQDELLLADPQEVGEIYKIHGSASDPESIVLTREDYDEYKARNAYLAAKLLTIFVEHPVVILGYGLGDPDVIGIVAEIARLMTRANVGSLRGRLVFVQWNPEAKGMQLVETAMVVDQQLSVPIISVTVPDFLGVFASLSRTVRKFPARSLRRIKEYIHDLVLTTDLQGRLYAESIDVDVDVSKVDVVLGIGVQQHLIARLGYKALERDDLFKDVLADESQYDSAAVVNDTLPRLLSGGGRTPVFRYLRSAGYLTADGNLRPNAVVPDAVGRRVRLGITDYGPPPSMAPRAHYVASQVGNDLKRLLAEYQPWDVSTAIGLLPPERIDLRVLRRYLLDHQGDWHASLPRAICYFDYLMYGNLALRRRPRRAAAATA